MLFHAELQKTSFFFNYLHKIRNKYNYKYTLSHRDANQNHQMKLIAFTLTLISIHNRLQFFC